VSNVAHVSSALDNALDAPLWAFPVCVALDRMKVTITIDRAHTQNDVIAVRRRLFSARVDCDDVTGQRIFTITTARARTPV